MASTFTIKTWLLALFLFYISLSNGKLGEADENFPEIGGATEDPIVGGGATEDPIVGGGGATEDPTVGGGVTKDPPQIGGATEDPTPIVTKALICFNNKYIYSSCEEAYRLDESGNLHVPPEHTDEFCYGPCLAETNLVLKCVENIVGNFEFYNKATIYDVRGTLKAGCGHGIHRGDFNVEGHLEAEENKADVITYGGTCLASIISAFVLVLIQLLQ